jgi:tellurite resistance protein TerC
MIWFWIGFLSLVAFFLALDLGVFHRKDHKVTMKEALTWSAVWITTSLLFSVFIYFAYGNHWQGLGLKEGTTEVTISGGNAWAFYLQAYVLEWSLSVDNLFVIALIFTYFRIPEQYQHRVLFWGILGAVVMRGVFITAGSAILDSFHWMIYLFGAFLIFTAIKMLMADEDPDISKSKLVKFITAKLPVTMEFHGKQFLARVTGPDGKVSTYLTPLALALIVVEATDLIFAVDSIPAAFGITRDPFIIFTSNIFAVMGLRSMYFALSSLMGKFHYLKLALAIILMVVGIKMLAEHWIKQNVWLDRNIGFLTLGFIAITLTTAVLASLKRKPDAASDSSH